MRMGILGAATSEVVGAMEKALVRAAFR